MLGITEFSPYLFGLVRADAARANPAFLRCGAGVTSRGADRKDVKPASLQPRTKPTSRVCSDA